jgi:chemotaxis protein CheD
MYLRNSSKYGKDVKIIHPGEYYVSLKDEMIGTLLGSCIAVCIADLKNGVAGMNHFMLPGRITEKDIFTDRTARYGITAINSLIDVLEKNGASKKNFISKIFGGGHVLGTDTGINAIPDDNIRLARIMMEMEDIPIVSSDVGENYTRKLLMDVKTGKVFLRKTTRQDVIDEINKRDIDYVKRSLSNG